MIAKSSSFMRGRPNSNNDHGKAHDVVSKKMPGHWLLARMGKRVLRPGGLELTQRLLTELAIGANDDVVELRRFGCDGTPDVLRQPRSYTAIERDRTRLPTVEQYVAGPNQRCVLGTAEETGLPDASATVVYGEAMLSMQMAHEIANRGTSRAALKPGERYGIHELCLVPADINPSIGEAIARDLSSDIHVGVRPLTVEEWRGLLTEAGLKVIHQQLAPMHLLEPARLVRDEGLLRAIQFVWNVFRDGEAVDASVPCAEPFGERRNFTFLADCSMFQLARYRKVAAHQLAWMPVEARIMRQDT